VWFFKVSVTAYRLTRVDHSSLVKVTFRFRQADEPEPLIAAVLAVIKVDGKQ
jgi:hypothetical protein